MKKKIIIIITLLLGIGTIAVFAFNPIVSETEEIVWAINWEITMLEVQILENKAEWSILDNEISNLKIKQDVFSNANNELRIQIEDLRLEKKSLGLN